MKREVEANGLSEGAPQTKSPRKEEKEVEGKKRGKSKMNSSYVRKMAVLSAKIFGNLPRPVSER